MCKKTQSAKPAILTLLTTAFALAVSQPALATKDQISTPSADDEIVVTGEKNRTEVLRQLIENQFNISRGGKHDGQYARFAAPICPSVGGLPEKQAAIMEDRIRDIAEVAELSVAPAKCRANLFVIAVDDGAREIATLRKNRSRLFASLSQRERDRMVENGGPVFSWKAKEAMSSGGRHSAKAGTIEVMSDTLGTISFQGQRSHIKSKVQQTDFVGINYSYLLIEKKALSNISLNQLADYAALVSLIDIDVNFEKAPPESSILSLFSRLSDDAIMPNSISEGDMLILRGLYKAPANVKAPLQRSAMIHTMRKEMERPEQ